MTKWKNFFYSFFFFPLLIWFWNYIIDFVSPCYVFLFPSIIYNIQNLIKNYKRSIFLFSKSLKYMSKSLLSRENFQLQLGPAQFHWVYPPVRPAAERPDPILWPIPTPKRIPFNSCKNSLWIGKFANIIIINSIYSIIQNNSYI